MARLTAAGRDYFDLQFLRQFWCECQLDFDHLCSVAVDGHLIQVHYLPVLRTYCYAMAGVSKRLIAVTAWQLVGG